jgi:hypothetical protein
MSNKKHGPSLYYATDKNIFDALNQHKVDTGTVMNLFQRRNIIVSKKTPREDLATYFSRLTHDYHDHKHIAARLGVTPRRERITSMDVTGAGEMEELQIAVEQLKQELEANGDVVQLSRDGDRLTMNVQYSIVDYKRSEFAQIQVRDGTIEFVKSSEGYVVRNTQNDYLNDVRETLLGKIENAVEAPLIKVTVSLFDVPSPKLRSKFFHELVNGLAEYKRRDVTDVYVYKAKPESDDEDDSDDTFSGDPDTHVERVFLRGNGVTRSELLSGLLEDEDYYIIKIAWLAKKSTGIGHVYDIEAVFADPKDCTGFSFILRGVFPEENGKVSSRRRAPTKSEVDAISRVIEEKSRELVIELREEFGVPSAGGA